MKRLLRIPRLRLRRDAAGDSGQAMLEFLLAFPAVLVLILMIMEYAYFVNVNQFAQYAAFAAARSLIVTNDDYATAAALAMVPFSDSGTLYQKINTDATAAKQANAVKDRLGQLTRSGGPYRRYTASNQGNRVLNAFNWQTCAWYKKYDAKDKVVTSGDFAYVKTGVCFTYPLRIQSLAPLSAWVMRVTDRSADDATVSSLFGGSTNALAPPPDRDYWRRAEDIRKQSGMIVVPVQQGCILGKR